MTRDPSDGTVREKSGLGIPISGLPEAPAKSDELIRLEKSREWLKGLQSTTEQSEIYRDHPVTKDAGA